MKIKLLILSFFILNFTNVFSQAPTWEWAKQASLTTGKQISKDVYKAKDGSVYLIGCNEDTAYYGNTVLDSGSFVAKYSSFGNFEWAKKVAGTVQGIVVDGNGNLFLLGEFSGGITIGSFNLLSNGGKDIYLTKLNSAGAVVWTKSYGGTKEDIGTAIKIDNADNIFITGYFTDSISFDGNYLKKLGSYLYQYTTLFYLVKINPSGIAVWAKTCPYNYPGNPYQYNSTSFLCLDKTGDIYVTGKYIPIPNCYWCGGGFILKYNSAGILKMDKREWDFFEKPYGLAVDDSLNILVNYWCGSHYSPCFTLEKYDSLMTTKWQKQVSQIPWNQYFLTSGLSVDSFSNIYITGYSSSDSLAFCGQLFRCKGATDILVTKLDSRGNCTWAKTAGGNGFENWPYGEPKMCVDRTGNCFITGGFNIQYNGSRDDTCAFDNDTLRNDGPWQQIYLAKIPSENSVATHINESAKPETLEIKIYPNPSSGNFTIQSQTEGSYSIINELGQKTRSFKLNSTNNYTASIENLSNGIYFITGFNKELQTKQKLIVTR